MNKIKNNKKLSISNFYSSSSFKEYLFYIFDLTLAIACGIVSAFFNLCIGNYLNVVIKNNNKISKNNNNLLLFSAVQYLLIFGCLLPQLSFLLYISINNSIKNSEINQNIIYRKSLIIFIRDLIFFLASISISFYCSFILTIPILITPILILLWTLISIKVEESFEQKTIIIKSSSFRNFKLSGHLLLFFINMSLGGLYGTKLVNLNLLKTPGDIFTIIIGIGTSSIQLANSFINLKYFFKQKNKKIKKEEIKIINNKNVNKNKKCVVFILDDNNEEKKCVEEKLILNNKFIKNILIWIRYQLLILYKWPFSFIFGLLACLAYSFGYPVFTRDTGLFFNVFEDFIDISINLLILKVKWLCFVYFLMGIIIFISITIWNLIFAKMGINLRNFIENEIKINKINLNWIEMVPLLSAELYFSIFCMLISICSAIQGNISMGLLAFIIFSFQVILQYFIFYKSINNNEKQWKLALFFASTNGLQQASQAIAYAGGFLLVQNGFVKALSVFKIIQTMHLGSTGLTTLLFISNDFIKTTKELILIETKKIKIIPNN